MLEFKFIGICGASNCGARPSNTQDITSWREDGVGEASRRGGALWCSTDSRGQAPVGDVGGGLWELILKLWLLIKKPSSVPHLLEHDSWMWQLSFHGPRSPTSQGAVMRRNPFLPLIDDGEGNKSLFHMGYNSGVWSAWPSSHSLPTGILGPRWMIAVR